MRQNKDKASLTWTKHLGNNQEAIEKFNNYFNSSRGILDRLKDILKEKQNDCQVFKKEDYKDPSWAYACADRNGYVRALQEIINILE